MSHLERPQPAGQPVGGEGLEGRDAEDPLARLGQVRDGATQAGHGLAGGPGQAFAGRGQDHLAGAADEQPPIQPFLQGLHLPAHRGLGDAQLLRRAREAAETGGGLEDADGAERNSGKHVRHKLLL